jgi:hypothetical protein
MHRRLSLFCGAVAVVAAWACGQDGRTTARTIYGDPACDTLHRNVDLFNQYAEQIKNALGTWNDIRVFERDNATKEWKLVSGWFVPVTIGGDKPEYYTREMDSDRPMMLPTTVQSDPLGLHSNGQSNPYSSVGRMPGTNPEVQWIWVVRQYQTKALTSDSFPFSPDMAVIGHHPRTGATAYLQYYDPYCPKPGEVMVSPTSAGGAQFWSPMDSLIPSFRCQRCHAPGPFIHTPWVNQVTIGGGEAADATPVEGVVPSDPMGPFFYVWSDSGQPFANWDSALIASKGGGHWRKPGNKCTQCHRIAPTMLGLNQNSTRYAGLPHDSPIRNGLAVRSDSFQTPPYRALHWMPPIDPQQIDFYAGQKDFTPGDWRDSYDSSASEINVFEPDTTRPGWRQAYERGWVADIPRPPKQYQTILVDRPLLDSVPPDQALWIVDSRMRANTDGNLHEWRFFGRDGTSGDVRAAPVVFRRRQNNGSKIEFEIVFVGPAQRASKGGDWLSLGSGGFALRQGDYLGMVFTNAGRTSGVAGIPYTDDDWAVLKNLDGSTWLRDGSVTYRVATPDTIRVGQRLHFKDAAFRTYSVEFRNKL